MARVAGEDTEEMDGKDFNEKEKKAFFFFLCECERNSVLVRRGKTTAKIFSWKISF